MTCEAGVVEDYPHKMAKRSRHISISGFKINIKFNASPQRQGDGMSSISFWCEFSPDVAKGKLIAELYLNKLI